MLDLGEWSEAVAGDSLADFGEVEASILVATDDVRAVGTNHPPELLLAEVTRSTERYVQ